MCWNLEVTTLFAFCETAVLLYIWRRDEYNDRANAIGHLPILAQEIIQVGLWMVMEPTDSPEICAPANRLFSFMCVAVVHAAPYAFATRSWRVAVNQRPGGPGTSPFMRRVITGFLADSGRAGVAMVTMTLLLMLSGMWVSCTVVGPGGHQIWPLLMTPDPTPRLIQANFPEIPAFPLIRWFSWAVYCGVLFLIVDSTPAVDLGVQGLKMLGPLFIALTMFYYGDEWGSIWCHLASVLCVLYLIIPWYRRQMNRGECYAIMESPYEHAYGWLADTRVASDGTGKLQASFGQSQIAWTHGHGLQMKQWYQSAFDADWGAGHDVTTYPKIDRDIPVYGGSMAGSAPKGLIALQQSIDKNLGILDNLKISQLISQDEYDQFKPWVKRGYEFNRNTDDSVAGKVALVPGKMEFTPAPANAGFGPGFYEQGAGMISQPRACTGRHPNGEEF